MTALLLALLGVLALLVVGVAALAVRLSRRVGLLEAQLETQLVAQTEPTAPRSEPQYVITQVGEASPEPEIEPEIEAVPTVAPGRFADLVLRETVVQAASLFHGVRRALSPETRNRIRFEMRREVKRSRKQRRADIREARREWEARQRAALLDDEASAA